MAKYVFLPAPAYGHVNPTLAVAQELVRRGEQVVYYLTEEFQTAIEATGATFQAYQSAMGKGQPSFRLPENPSAMMKPLLMQFRRISCSLPTFHSLRCSSAPASL